MKPKIMLKELLKPPFTSVGDGLIYDSSCCIINWNNELENKTGLASVRGQWSVFCNYENDLELQEEFCDFVIESINKNWAEKFSDPQRWGYSPYDGYDSCHFFVCPKCGHEMKFNGEWGKHELIGDLNYCPKCGVRLLPPEEVQDVE